MTTRTANPSKNPGLKSDMKSGLKSHMKSGRKRSFFSAAMGLLGLVALTGLAPGEMAPEFSAKNQDGKTVTLSQFKGKPVLLYFYPKDDTPGCTKEACLLRDYYTQFQKAGAVILGVSKQDAQSHQAFRKKHSLPFDLLVDDGAIAKAYGVGTYPMVGFHKRQSFLIDRNGQIARYYKDVDPATHATEVLKDLQGMK